MLGVQRCNPDSRANGRPHADGWHCAARDEWCRGASSGASASRAESIVGNRSERAGSRVAPNSSTRSGGEHRGAAGYAASPGQARGSTSGAATAAERAARSDGDRDSAFACDRGTAVRAAERSPRTRAATEYCSHSIQCRAVGAALCSAVTRAAHAPASPPGDAGQRTPGG